MIKTEYYDTRFDGVKLFRTYSDTHKKIRQDQTGTVYEEAIDVENRGYSYTETDIPLDIEEEPTIKEKAEAYDILVGVSE